MSTIRADSFRQFFVGGGAVACILLACSAFGSDQPVTVSARVSIRGLDLKQPEVAQKIYTQLGNAAWMLCTRGPHLGLAPVPNQTACYEEALGKAVASAKAPMLTEIYLMSHTVQDASSRGVDVPVQLATKSR